MRFKKGRQTMLDVHRNTLHLSSPQGAHPSLLPLRMALALAEKESPSRPPHSDVNEQNAVQLIANVKAQYKKQRSVLNFQDIPTPDGFHRALRDLEIIHA